MIEIPIKWELESGFQAAIVDLVKATGNRAYHTYNSKKSEPGFPDLTIYGPVGFLMVETKRVKTKCTIPQLETGARLVEVGMLTGASGGRTTGLNWKRFSPAGSLKLPRWPQGDVAEAREEKCAECGQRVTTVHVRTVGGSWILADGRSAPLCGGCLVNSETR